VSDFDWDEDNLQHISEHGVTADEAEYVLQHLALELEYQDWHATEERLQEVGITADGRFLIVVTTSRGNRIRVVTAYDAPNYAVQEYFKYRGA
jgi:uncharacterized protein